MIKLVFGCLSLLLQAKFCWKGNQMFPALDNDLHFGYQVRERCAALSSPCAC
jgi:hypothetical protein